MTPVLRPGPCSHPSVSDEAIRAAATQDPYVPTPRCPDCREWLYPHGDGETVTAYIDEPYGAGR